MTPKVLFVLTSHDKIDAIDKPTGWFLPEFAHPYNVLKDHCEIIVASPLGGPAPLDPMSIDFAKDDSEAQRFLSENANLWQNTVKLEDLEGRVNEFDAIFFIGGHGPMYDFPESAAGQQLTRDFYESNKVVAAVCHGPAALVNVKLSTGDYLLANQAATGFSNTEEDQVQLLQAMPFSLEDRLVQRQAVFEKAAEPWGSKVVLGGKDGRLITGQNPASAGPTASAVLRAISV